MFKIVNAAGETQFSPNSPAVTGAEKSAAEAIAAYFQDAYGPLFVVAEEPEPMFSVVAVAVAEEVEGDVVVKVQPEVVAPWIQPGSMFSCSWGYDQTQVDFYRVISRTAKSVRVQKWQGAYVEQDGPHDSVVAGDGPVMVADWSACTPEMDHWDRQAAMKQVPAEIVTRRLRVWGEKASFSVNSYSSASEWDGRAMYQTGQGYGH